MSHLRDLQKLRNAKIYLPNKKLFNIIKLNEIQKNFAWNFNNEVLIMPDFVVPRMEELGRDTYFDPYSRYIDSKQIQSGCQSKLNHQQPSSKNENQKYHRRGGSVGSSHNNNHQKPLQPPASPFAIHNFTLKLINPQSQFKQSNKRDQKSNPVTPRKDKVPQFHVNQLHAPIIRVKKERGHHTKQKLNQDRDQHYMVGKKSFQVIFPVGKGGFGKVWKVKCKKTGEILAMKQMQKGKIIAKKSINSVVNQRVLLADLHHPFLINMKSAFQNRQNLYLVMDYVNGGDLRYHIAKRGKFSQNQTKFFISNIIICLEYLHSQKIIHRDLKPENLVFDSNGFLYTTDLGVSQIVKDDNSYDTSGTPGYMAPEVLCSKKHSYPVDYFAVGVIAYQLMLGHRPYQGKNRKQIRENILSRQAEVKIDQIPYKWSVKAADFINKLLQRNPQKRLGISGIQQLKNHPWLFDVDWKCLQHKSVQPPYIPNTIQEHYQDYKQQISQDSVDENVEQTYLLLRDQETQSLFEGYDYEPKRFNRKKSLRSTFHSDSDQLSISIRGSLKMN